MQVSILFNFKMENGYTIKMFKFIQEKKVKQTYTSYSLHINIHDMLITCFVIVVKH